MSFFPSRSAYTRSAEKPGVGLGKRVSMVVQGAALTRKADVLDQVKSIDYVFIDLATANFQLSDLGL